MPAFRLTQPSWSENACHVPEPSGVLTCESVCMVGGVGEHLLVACIVWDVQHLTSGVGAPRRTTETDDASKYASRQGPATSAG